MRAQRAAEVDIAAAYFLRSKAMATFGYQLKLKQPHPIPPPLVAGREPIAIDDKLFRLGPVYTIGVARQSCKQALSKRHLDVSPTWPRVAATRYRPMQSIP